MKIETKAEYDAAEAKWQKMFDRLFDDDFTDKEMDEFGELGAAILDYEQHHKS